MFTLVSFEFHALKLMKSLVEDKEFREKIHLLWKYFLSLLQNYEIQM
jgi:hypothetical protein